MILVSSLLDNTNYLPWSTAMRITLDANEKMGFIDGSLKMPLTDEGSKFWKKVNQMIMSWLLIEEHAGFISLVSNFKRYMDSVGTKIRSD